MAGHRQRNRAITSGRGNRETRDDGTAHTANTGQANGRGGLEGAHTPIRGCMCMVCRNGRQAGAVARGSSGGGGGGGGRTRVRFDLWR